jgi:hypothetical protein
VTRGQPGRIDQSEMAARGALGGIATQRAVKCELFRFRPPKGARSKTSPAPNPGMLLAERRHVECSRPGGAEPLPVAEGQ